jgi:hypothetical protein
MPSPLAIPAAAIRAMDNALQRVHHEEQTIKSQSIPRKRLQALLAFVKFPSRVRAHS